VQQCPPPADGDGELAASDVGGEFVVSLPADPYRGPTTPELAQRRPQSRVSVASRGGAAAAAAEAVPGMIVDAGGGRIPSRPQSHSSRQSAASTAQALPAHQRIFRSGGLAVPFCLLAPHAQMPGSAPLIVVVPDVLESMGGWADALLSVAHDADCRVLVWRLPGAYLLVAGAHGSRRGCRA
jgi:hypothetical protein